jgi:hypothetical protein
MFSKILVAYDGSPTSRSAQSHGPTNSHKQKTRM